MSLLLWPEYLRHFQPISGSGSDVNGEPGSWSLFTPTVIIIVKVFKLFLCMYWGIPGGTSCKEPGPGLGRSPGGQHGNPLQSSCLENLMDRGSWQATVHGVTKRQT